MYILLVLFFTGFSCVNNNPVNIKDPNANNTISLKRINIVSPIKNQEFKDNSNIVFKVSLVDSSLLPDSVQLLMDGKKIGHIKNLQDSFVFNAENQKLGTRSIDAIGYFPGGIKDHDYSQVQIRLSKIPVNYSYKIIQTYPHDRTAYTQGLIYENNYYYEGTGLYERSTLRKVNLITGEPVKIYNLPPDVFGEGITIFDNKIIQISWKEQVAFLYDKESFQLLNKYNYPIKEGWGITYDGKNLVMSNGTSVIYFLDKEYFTEVSRIEVFDEKGPVEQLNELEYINGEIWANIYLSDFIVRINPNTGAVIGKIDLTGLLDEKDRDTKTDVLNGIAYDNSKDRIFVTGKNWPKFFEISIFPKK
jgi:glutamine cyclotransferase